MRSSDVAACRLGVETPRAADELLPVELGVDVGGGGDETVIRERRGPVAGREWRERSDQPNTIAPLVLRAIRETGATRVKIDSTGIGSVVSAVERLVEQRAPNAWAGRYNDAVRERNELLTAARAVLDNDFDSDSESLTGLLALVAKIDNREDKH